MAYKKDQHTCFYFPHRASWIISLLLLFLWVVGNHLRLIHCSQKGRVMRGKILTTLLLISYDRWFFQLLSHILLLSRVYSRCSISDFWVQHIRNNPGTRNIVLSRGDFENGRHRDSTEHCWPRWFRVFRDTTLGVYTYWSSPSCFWLLHRAGRICSSQNQRRRNTGYSFLSWW